MQALNTLNATPIGGRNVDGSRGELGPELRAHYMAAVTSRYRLLELSTLAPDGAEEQPVAVTQVFVPQQVRPDPPPLELPRDVRRRLARVQVTSTRTSCLRSWTGSCWCRPESGIRPRRRGQSWRWWPTCTTPAGSAWGSRRGQVDPAALPRGHDDPKATPSIAAKRRARPSGLSRWLPLLVELRGYADPGWRCGRWADATVLDHLD